jgi:sigma-B regulation protein RsbU (phosphoserine phosphatase)
MRKTKLAGEVVTPDRAPVFFPPGSTTSRIETPIATQSADAATVLLAHLFAAGDRDIPGVSYAVAYRLAEMQSGGDIVDVYQFDNGAVALSIADISGKGTQAAVHAALIKYGLRAYASHGLTAETTMRAMDRLYLENSTFEHAESFASVFLAVVDPTRKMMSYSNAGHEPVILVNPHLPPQLLAPTAPVIGVFDDQHHLFRQETVDLWPGTLLVAVTDGITEMKNEAGEFFGIERLCDCVDDLREADPAAIVDALIGEIGAFSGAPLRDDVAVLVARFGDSSARRE